MKGSWEYKNMQISLVWCDLKPYLHRAASDGWERYWKWRQIDESYHQSETQGFQAPEGCLNK